MRQGEIHVVAADQQMIAHRDSLENQFAALFGHADQREIGRAAADIAHQERVVDGKQTTPTLAGRTEQA